MPDDLQFALPFDTDSREFTRGVQVGLLWAQLNPTRTLIVYRENAEMIARIMERQPGTFTVTDENDDWIRIDFV